MEGVAGEVNGVELGVADLDTFFICARIDRAFDFQSGRCRRRADQLDDRETVGERTSAPVLGDVAEQAVFDPVPLGRAGRMMMHLDREPGLVRRAEEYVPTAAPSSAKLS